ncbi:GNAT family N-acetyltransferase [Nitrosomonas sp. Nm34]|uniref:GNAT family N-acetyltransferase n=1 Tax=Nitrosomonas sp. Nm34 TaxID=1881055 RepID=UPI0008E82567|nr:GNAT family N-acetyltransferase [Nitrosomonas sp. Nm34]SFI61194.1 Predicted N-acetyltransferase YhbS [Nitrosomonas sp. Nm34]
MHLRKGSLHDAARIAVLVNSAYRGDSSRHGWTTEADFIDGQRTDTSEIEEILSADNQCILLAERNEEIIGCVHLEKRDANVCYFGMFVVKPKLQAQGLGKRLIMEAERFASHQLACTIMQMHVISIRNELIAWYERRGYRRTDERHPFPYGNERFGIPLRNDLEFIVFVKELKAN